MCIRYRPKKQHSIETPAARVCAPMAEMFQSNVVFFGRYWMHINFKRQFEAASWYNITHSCFKNCCVFKNCFRDIIFAFFETVKQWCGVNRKTLFTLRERRSVPPSLRLSSKPIGSACPPRCGHWDSYRHPPKKNGNRCNKPRTNSTRQRRHTGGAFCLAERAQTFQSFFAHACLALSWFFLSIFVVSHFFSKHEFDKKNVFPVRDKASNKVLVDNGNRCQPTDNRNRFQEKSALCTRCAAWMRDLWAQAP